MSRYYAETEEERDILNACALRFDGYKYIETLGLKGEDINEYLKPLSENLELHEDVNKNFAVFFFLQRFLSKWGGEYLSPYSDKHIAFRFLFLELYNREVPAEYRFEDYWNEWQRKYEPRREDCAAVIRKTFRRKGIGSKTLL